MRLKEFKMVNIKKQHRMNEAMGLLSSSFRTDKNSVRINTNNTLIHEISKLIIMYREIKKKKTVYSEAIFKNGSRADIFIPEDYRVIEVLHSETEKEALAKIKAYPEELDIILTKTEDLLRRTFYDKYMDWVNSYKGTAHSVLLGKVGNVLSIFDEVFRNDNY